MLKDKKDHLNISFKKRQEDKQTAEATSIHTAFTYPSPCTPAHVTTTCTPHPPSSFTHLPCIRPQINDVYIKFTGAGGRGGEGKEKGGGEE